MLIYHVIHLLRWYLTSNEYKSLKNYLKTLVVCKFIHPPKILNTSIKNIDILFFNYCIKVIELHNYRVKYTKYIFQ